MQAARWAATMLGVAGIPASLLVVLPLTDSVAWTVASLVGCLGLVLWGRRPWRDC